MIHIIIFINEEKRGYPAQFLKIEHDADARCFVLFVLVLVRLQMEHETLILHPLWSDLPPGRHIELDGR